MNPAVFPDLPPTIRPMSSALDGLRTATGSLHARLDTGLPIGRAGASLADYVSHLQTLRPWLVKSQAMLRAVDTSALGAAADRIERRLATIDADLAETSDLPRDDARGDAHRPVQTASVSAAHGWGRAYVVEGSGLGGRMLFKRLQQRLAPHPLRYLAGDAAVTPARGWADFTAELALHVQTSSDRLEAQQGAIDAFSELLSSFAEGVSCSTD